MQLNDDAFGPGYFTGLYGEIPSQTWVDRSRDDLVSRLVARHDGPARGLPLLDLGCGYGYLLERFRGRYQLYGADISPHAVQVAASRLPEATFATADAEQELPFPILFQIILLVNVLEHLAHPARALDRLHAALRPGGLCVVHLPTINNGLNRLYYRRSYAKDPTHVFRPSGAQVTRLFEAGGFERLEDSYAPHRPARLWRALKPFPPYLAVYRRRP